MKNKHKHKQHSFKKNKTSEIEFETRLKDVILELYDLYYDDHDILLNLENSGKNIKKMVKAIDILLDLREKVQKYEQRYTNTA